MSKHFLRDLDRLRRNLLGLGAVVEDHLNNAITAVEKGDKALAEEVIGNDERIDHEEVEIEEECLKIIALYQPVADDLRFLIAALKITNDLERIGDLAVNIAERVLMLAGSDRAPFPFDFRTMAAKAQEMIRFSLDAFIDRDTRIAQRVFPMDDEVDNINRSMYLHVTEMVEQHPKLVEPLLNLLGVSRQIERVADLATNIAESVVFMVDGEIVRHRTDDYRARSHVEH
jgi:phosphate transport system protein